MLQANFVKINLWNAVSVLVLDMCTGTFLFPNYTLSAMMKSYAVLLLS